MMPGRDYFVKASPPTGPTKIAPPTRLTINPPIRLAPWMRLINDALRTSTGHHRGPSMMNILPKACSES